MLSSSTWLVNDNVLGILLRCCAQNLWAADPIQRVGMAGDNQVGLLKLQVMDVEHLFRVTRAGLESERLTRVPQQIESRRGGALNTRFWTKGS